MAELTFWMAAPISKEPTDLTSWIRAAKSGNLEAFRELIQFYQRKVLGIAFRLLGRMDLAQDAAQEVFLRLYKYLHRFKENADFYPWLYTMTVNVSRNLRRKGADNRCLSLDAILLEKEIELPSKAADPQTQMLKSEQRQWVHNALRYLSEKEREVLVLRDIEGLSTREVATILGSSEATVRVQASQARLKIRKQLEIVMGKRL